MTDLTRETRDRLAEAWHASALTPSAEDLAAAPLIDEWVAFRTMTGRPLLLGKTTGHPSLGDTEISTSPVMTIDVEAGYARTQSRWYRLGRKMADTQPEEIAKMRSMFVPMFRIIEGDDLMATVQEERDRIEAALASHRPDA